MIPRIHKRGSNTRMLLRYLYGPGRREDHDNAHLVGAWDAGVVDAYSADPVDAASVRALADLLDAPVHAMPRPVPRHVWHTSVRNHPADRFLTDAEWAHIAARLLDAAGIAPAGDPHGCRWIAIRHADDHIHIVATLARQDQHRPSHHNDALRLRAEARRLETELGLTPTRATDRTAAAAPTRQELGKAAQQGRDEPTRTWLAHTVRAAAAAAADEDEFFTRLTDAGLLVGKRREGGAVVGYRVAHPNHRAAGAADGGPIWYAGSRLAPDLSPPRVRARFTTASGTAPSSIGSAWNHAAHAVRAAEAAFAHGTPVERAAFADALGDLLAVAASAAPQPARKRLTQAADTYDRAARVPGRRQPGTAAATGLRIAARNLAQAQHAYDDHHDLAAAANLAAAMSAATASVAVWHAARGRQPQQAAATLAAETLAHLAEPLPIAAATTRLPAYTTTVQTALTDIIPDIRIILDDPAWPALQATLRATRRLGQDPAEALRGVARHRELDSARSPAQVLTWRLRSHLTTARRQATMSARRRQLDAFTDLVPTPARSGDSVRPREVVARR